MQTNAWVTLLASPGIPLDELFQEKMHSVGFDGDTTVHESYDYC